METRRNKGITLVEVMVATLISLIVILGAAICLAGGQSSWDIAWRKANLQRDASHAILKMTRTIMTASAAQIDDVESKAIKIYDQADWTRFSIDPGTKQLQCQLNGQPAYNLTDGKVWDVLFTVTDNQAVIDLRGSDGNLQTHFVKTIMMRNYVK